MPLHGAISCVLVIEQVGQSGDGRVSSHCERVNNNLIYFSLSSDWLILHDQSVPGGHRHSVLRDQAEGEPADEGAAGALHVQRQHSGLPLRAGLLLR